MDCLTQLEKGMEFDWLFIIQTFTLKLQLDLSNIISTPLAFRNEVNKGIC